MLSEAIYILLSQQTRDAVYRRVFRQLREAFPRWADVLAADTEEVEEILRPAGFQRRRVRHCSACSVRSTPPNAGRGIGAHDDPPGDLTLEMLYELSDAEAEAALVALPGIGPKSARCMLAYSLGRAAFAVDTHVHCVVTRLGLVRSIGRKADHDLFQAAVPAKLRHRLHVNLVHHGHAVCRTNNERCGECVLVSFCGRGRERVADDRPVDVDLFAGAGSLGSASARPASASDSRSSPTETRRRRTGSTTRGRQQ